MAEFRLRKDAEGWFRNIATKHPITTKFDLYYLCMMLGLASRRASNPAEAGKAPGFVDSFVGDYRGREYLVIGLLLRAELAGLGCALGDRTEVRATLARLVGPAGLSAEGVARLNEYASGGFDLLQERWGDLPPFAPEEFLPRYLDLIQTTIEEQDFWADT